MTSASASAPSLQASQWQFVVQQVNATDNKALLWSLLSEENVFTGLTEQSTQSVVTLFETAIHTTVNTYLQNQDPSSLAKIQTQGSQFILSELNKDVIKRVIQDVAQYRHGSLSTPSQLQTFTTPSSHPHYKSADIQEARIRDITSKVKVLENDMNSFLVLKKPPEINFADQTANDDVPIGDNMDQLIKEALASRARELEVIQFDSPVPAESPTTSSSSSSSSRTQPPKKMVSFESSSEHVTQVEHEGSSEADVEIEIGAIFNKLKRPQPPHPNPSQNATYSTQIDSFAEVRTSSGSSPKLEEIISAIRGLQVAMQSLVSDVQFIKDNMFVYDPPSEQPSELKHETN